MKRVLSTLTFVTLLAGSAFGQSVPNHDTPITTGVTWTPSQWITAFQSKQDYNAPGVFTSLTASGAVSGAGITSLFASPPPTGITTPNSGAFTSLSATGYMDVTTESGVDPTGATDSSAGFNAALATGKTVHIPCGVYHLANPVTVGTATGQRLYGDGLCSRITVGTDFASSASAVFWIATDPSFNTQIDGFQITFSQPPDLLQTAASASASGATTVTMNSVAGIVVGQNVIDNTTTSAIPVINAATPMTTVASISGNVITLSQPIAGSGVQSGDTLAFASTRAQFVSLPSCTLVAGSGGCEYPPAIRGTNVKRPRIENMRISGAYNGIYLYADAEAYVDSVEVGAFSNGVFVEDFTDNGFISRIKFAGFGIPSALSYVQLDGQANCLSAGRTDGGLFTQLACFEGSVSLLSTFTSGTFSDVYIDGVNDNFNIAALGSSSDVKIANLHVDTNGAPSQSKCMLDISGGSVVVANAYLWAQSGAENGFCVRGGVVTLTGGEIVVNYTNAHNVAQTGGELTMTGVLLHSGNGLAVPAIYQTAGIYRYIGNTVGGPLLGGVNAIQATDASDPTDAIIANVTGGHAIVWPGQNPIVPGVLGSPWHYTAPNNGTLIVSGGTVSNIAITRGTTTIQTGVTAGAFTLDLNDTVAVTYSAAPTLTFLPQ